MSTQRCWTCGGIVDTKISRFCPGCGATLSGAYSDDEPLLPPVMREAKQDAGAGRIVLSVLGALVLAGMFGATGAGPFGVLLVLAIGGAFIKSVASQNAAESEAAAAVTGVLDLILRGLAILFVIGIVLAVGTFVFIYIVCLTQGGGRW